MRKLNHPINIHVDHTSAVVDVDYAPTGREFVSGSYDKTVRIFESLKGHSRDVYHTKRMQRLTCVKWSLDNKYVLTGSDEMNIRMWKARASEKLGVVSILRILKIFDIFHLHLCINYFVFFKSEIEQQMKINYHY